MEQLISHKRVSFGGGGPMEETSGCTGRKGTKQTESLRGIQEQGWLPTSLPRYMIQVHDPEEMEFAVAVSAAAYAIDAAEERKRRAREEVERSRIGARGDMKSGPPSSDRVPRRLSSREIIVAGETSTTRNSIRPEYGEKPRHVSNGAGVKKHKGGSSRHNAAETWEKSQMEKIRRRYEKMKSSILAWENGKKTLARKKQARIQADFEERKARNQRHYQEKMGRIEQISGGARLQAEQKRRQEEVEAKEKAKNMRASKRVPARYCFCF